MSMSRRAAKKKDDIFSKKVPENPKYKHIKATVDTGSSVSKYMERLEEIKKNYRYRNDEIFKRIKVNTFAQLVLQVANVVSMERRREDLSTAGSIDDCDSMSPAYEERMNYETADENVPPLNLSRDETERLKTGSDTARSTLQDVICGVGEVDLREHDDQNGDTDLLSSRSSQAPVTMPDVDSLPYLLLDIRNEDDYKQSHIIGALNYPMSRLSRSVNYFTKEILSFKGKAGKIIILYDEDERMAWDCASIFVQRGIDNSFMLSGGMKVLSKHFPEGFITGTLPTSCLPSPPPTRKATKRTPPTFLTSDGQHWEFFTSSHLEKIQGYLDEELLKKEGSSRMSSRVSSRSSVASTSSRLSTTSTASSKTPWK